jgi:hypothetical protein
MQATSVLRRLKIVLRLSSSLILLFAHALELRQARPSRISFYAYFVKCYYHL